MTKQAIYPVEKIIANILFSFFLKQMIQREADVKNKVTAVALTDSVHNVWHQEAGKTIREWMREVRLGFFQGWDEWAWAFPSWAPTNLYHLPPSNFLSGGRTYRGNRKKPNIYEIIRGKPFWRKNTSLKALFLFLAFCRLHMHTIDVGTLAEESHGLLRGYYSLIFHFSISYLALILLNYKE